MRNQDKGKRYRDRVLKNNTPERPRGERTSRDMTPDSPRERELDPDIAEQLDDSVKARRLLSHQEEENDRNASLEKRD